MDSERSKDKYIEGWLAKTREIVLKNLDKKSFLVFLFGSRAGNIYSHSSDIDVGILGPEPVDRKIILNIQDELENSVVPFKIDVVDFFMADEKFKKIAEKNIVIWNRPDGNAEEWERG